MGSRDPHLLELETEGMQTLFCADEVKGVLLTGVVPNTRLNNLFALLRLIRILSLAQKHEVNTRPVAIHIVPCHDIQVGVGLANAPDHF